MWLEGVPDQPLPDAFGDRCLWHPGYLVPVVEGGFWGGDGRVVASTLAPLSL
jgi:hypothetical protein